VVEAKGPFVFFLEASKSSASPLVHPLALGLLREEEKNVSPVLAWSWRNNTAGMK